MKNIPIKFNLFNIENDPYNGGKSYYFNIELFAIGGIFYRYLFRFKYNKFYQWKNRQIELDILFINLISKKPNLKQL